MYIITICTRENKIILLENKFLLIITFVYVEFHLFDPTNKKSIVTKQQNIYTLITSKNTIKFGQHVNDFSGVFTINLNQAKQIIKLLENVLHTYNNQLAYN